MKTLFIAISVLMTITVHAALHSKTVKISDANIHVDSLNAIESFMKDLSSDANSTVAKEIASYERELNHYTPVHMRTYVYLNSKDSYIVTRSGGKTYNGYAQYLIPLASSSKRFEDYIKFYVMNTSYFVDTDGELYLEMNLSSKSIMLPEAL